jgi:carboxyl-terminal processing protease
MARSFGKATMLKRFLLSLSCLVALGAATPDGRARVRDFDQMVAFVRVRYAWPERIDLERMRAALRPRAAGAADPAAFHEVLEDFLDGLGDAHSHLGSNRPASWCLPPGQVAAEWQGDRAVLVGVWPGSPAAEAGLRPGMVVRAWNGLPLSEALRARAPLVPEPPHPEVARWRLNALLAGRHNQGCRLTVEDALGIRQLDLPAGDPTDPPLPEARIIEGAIGHIAFQELGSTAQVARMDAALGRFPQARAWIIDLRGLRVGGSTGVTLPIMGRFLEKPGIYAWMQRRRGPRLGRPWAEPAKPRGSIFRGPLVVLVDPWTASAAEGMAMGLSGLGRATVVGTRMAGLGAAVHSITLRHSGLRVQISTEPVLDVHHRPRSDFRPDLLVDLAGPGDPILDAGIREVKRRLQAAQ